MTSSLNHQSIITHVSQLLFFLPRRNVLSLTRNLEQLQATQIFRIPLWRPRLPRGAHVPSTTLLCLPERGPPPPLARLDPLM